MTTEEIKANAPDGATGYINVNNKVYYVKKILGVWHATYNYDCCDGWAFLNNNYVDQIKPL